MLVPDIIKYCRGYLTLKVEGLNIERFLNMSIMNGINFWDIKRINITETYLKVSIGGYRSLKKILRKTGCRVSIIDKGGLPFFIAKMNKRKMMGFGIAVFLFIILFMSSFIWSVEVTGAVNVNTKDIVSNLAELGVRPGAFKLNIPIYEIENNMLIRMGGISWIKVRLKGTRAYVEIKERVIPPKVVSEDKPCNVVAARDGIIIKIVSSEGDVLVSPGDTVSKGQILVKGTIERELAEKRFVHASAEVEARTWYERSTAVPLDRLEKARTGNKAINIYLKWNNKRFNIKNSNITYKSYDKIERSTKLIDMDSFQLPLEIVIEEYWETTLKRRTLTVDEAKNEAASKVEKFIIDNMPSNAKIINKKINITVKENVVYASGLIETIEDIGVQQEIN